MEYLSPKLLEAFEFSALAHGKQMRKNPGHIPYFSHPAAVAHILSQAGFGEEVVIAGLLHDVIEDTEYGAKDIEERFGARVLELVQGVTERKDLEWAERNRMYNEHLREMDEEVVAISAADFLANRQSLLMEFRKGNNPWVNFSKNPKEYAEKRLLFDTERLEIIKSKISVDFVKELEELEEETIEFTQKIEWENK